MGSVSEVAVSCSFSCALPCFCACQRQNCLLQAAASCMELQQTAAAGQVSRFAVWSAITPGCWAMPWWDGVICCLAGVGGLLASG